MNVLSYMYVAVPLKNCPFCTEKQTALYPVRTHHEVAFMSYCGHIIDLHITGLYRSVHVWKARSKKN